MSLFCNKTLREISIRTQSIYLVDGKPIKHVFVFTPSVGVKYFWVDLNGMACFCVYPQCSSSVYLGGVHDLDFKSMTNLSVNKA